MSNSQNLKSCNFAKVDFSQEYITVFQFLNEDFLSNSHNLDNYSSFQR